MAFECDVCGQSFETERGMKRHRTVMHFPKEETENRDEHKTTTKTSRKEIMADTEAADIIAQVYPRGIPTDDPASLLRSIYWIDDLRNRLRNR